MAYPVTAAVRCPQAGWAQLADGAAYALCRVQAAGAGALAIAVAAAEPDADTNDFFVVPSMQSLDLVVDSSDTVWGRGLAGDVVARVLLTEAS